MKENGREKKKSRLLQEAFSISMNESLQSLVSGLYAILHIHTKISKENHYYIGTNLEEIKKSQQ